MFADRRLRRRFQSTGDPMSRSIRAGVVAVAAIALGIGLAGCGSDTKSRPSTSKQTSSASSSTTSKAAPSTSAQAAGPNKTIVDYIKENGIVESPVHRGDPGAPTIDLPFPPGWEDAGPRTPQWAYGGGGGVGGGGGGGGGGAGASAVCGGGGGVVVSKLAGNVDPAKILEYAPGEIKNLPGYDGSQEGSSSTLGGFDATAIGGT